jgi:taurine dioxygenase
MRGVMVTCTVTDLDDGLQFGARVTGLEPAMLDDTTERSSLYDLWIDPGVVIFEAVAGGAEVQIRLSEVFGDCEVHPLRPKDAVSPPALADIRYLPEAGDIFEIDGERRGGWLPWHSDLIYVDTINHGGILARCAYATRRRASWTRSTRSRGSSTRWCSRSPRPAARC